MVDLRGTTITDVMSFDLFNLRSSLIGKVVGQHRVTAWTTGAPDLISWLEYGTEDYWHILCLVNGIIDPISEIVPPMVMVIPLQTDINNYIQGTNVQSRSVLVRFPLR